MIDFKTTAEQLNELAQDEFAASRGFYARAFQSAAQDLANLTAHALWLEERVAKLMQDQVDAATQMREYDREHEHIADIKEKLCDIKSKIMEVIEDD